MPRKTKQNKLTSPELLAQVNPENLRLKKEFLDYLKALNRSEGTRRQYDSDLAIFFCWVLQNANNKAFQKVSKRDIVAFQNWMINENGNSPARVRRIKSAISSLSNFIEAVLDEEEEFKEFRPIVRKIADPTLQPVREKTVWSEDELELLLQRLTEKHEYQKACCVALAMYGGRRKAELCRFRVDDFTEDRLVCDGALYQSAPILTKGNKYLECYTLAKKFTPYLNAWLAQRDELGVESELLFVSPSDWKSPLSESTLNSWAASFSKITGKDFYFHSLRHFYCTSLIKAGIPDSVVVDIIGWSSSEMLKIYDDSSKDEKLAMFFKDGDICVPNKAQLSDL